MHTLVVVVVDIDILRVPRREVMSNCIQITEENHLTSILSFEIPKLCSQKTVT